MFCKLTISSFRLKFYVFTSFYKLLAVFSKPFGELVAQNVTKYVFLIIVYRCFCNGFEIFSSRATFKTKFLKKFCGLFFFLLINLEAPGCLLILDLEYIISI